MYKLFLSILFLFTIVSCKNNNNSNKHSVKVLVDLMLLHDDNLQIFYKIKADDDYNELLSIKKTIHGKNEIQTITFELPAGIKPKNFRIDLGENPKMLDSILIKNISFQYKNNLLNGANGEYKKWFDLNSQTIESVNNWYYLKPHEQNFDPFLSGNRNLNAVFIKLFPPDIKEF